MKIKQIIFFALAILLLGSCKKFNDSYDALLNDPNATVPSSADADLFLNAVQLNFKSFYGEASNFGAEVTRMQHMYGPNYQNAYSAESFDGLWTTAYTGIFKNANAMIPIALAQKKYTHVGMAQIMKAYTMFTLVDYFGNVPYSEANQGINITNPKADSGRNVYNAALVLLDSAIANLKKPADKYPTNDLFYTGSNNSTKWITVAKTLKLKAFFQMIATSPTPSPLADKDAIKTKINALIAENDLINNESQNFVFKFSTKDNSPDSRHPKFVNNYAGSSGVSDYLANYFMSLMNDELNGDPRMRYYFYRQTEDIFAAIPDETTLAFTIPCVYRDAPPGYNPYCIVGTGYLGRDHGNAEGIPPDGKYRATFGIYPAGGEFDADQFSPTNASMGAKGAGIYPIWMSSYTDLLQAQAAFILGTTGDVRSLLLSGVNKSITTVMNYPATVGYVPDPAAVPRATQITNYNTLIGRLYDRVVNERLDLLSKEYMIALWGNGIESYNQYRRLALPGNLQPLLLPSTTNFIRSFKYPAVCVNLNQNIKQKTETTVKVFWDVNPDNLYK
ncbi:SusD/RagB family nutrient-binding outer membrane lipoprotein [soil metagenome]